MSRKQIQRRATVRVAPRRAAGTKPRDPFAGVKPVKDVSRLIGGLPDDRSAEEILADLRARHRRRPSA